MTDCRRACVRVAAPSSTAALGDDVRRRHRGACMMELDEPGISSAPLAGVWTLRQDRRIIVLPLMLRRLPDAGGSARSSASCRCASAPTASARGLAAADRRRPEADLQGDHRSTGGAKGPVLIAGPCWPSRRRWPPGRWCRSTTALVLTPTSTPGLLFHDGHHLDGRCTASSSPAGRPTRSTPSSAPCAGGADGVLRNRDGFALAGRADLSGLNLTDIVMPSSRAFRQHGVGFLSWNWLPLLLPMFLVYLIPASPKPTAHPFDVVEGEPEIVAGHMVEYSAWPSRCSSSPNTPT